MKNWKVSLITILSFFAISSMVLFSSCEQDPCTELNCINGGNCTDGYCNCPAGFEGTECDIPAADRFLGEYYGTVKCSTSQGGIPAYGDTARVTLVEGPNRVRLDIGLGNTYISFEGEARTPETKFVTHLDNDVTVHAYMTVDNELIHIYLESSDESIEYRQVCRFVGRRIAE